VFGEEGRTNGRGVLRIGVDLDLREEEKEDEEKEEEEKKSDQSSTNKNKNQKQKKQKQKEDEMEGDVSVIGFEYKGESWSQSEDGILSPLWKVCSYSSSRSPLSINYRVRVHSSILSIKQSLSQLSRGKDVNLGREDFYSFCQYNKALKTGDVEVANEIANEREK